MADEPRRHHRKKSKPGWAGLREDLAGSFSRIVQRSSINHKRFVLAVILIGTILRIIRLNGPITYDEALTYVNYASRSFSFLLSDLTFQSNHILYSALARLSTLVFGVHAWSLRLPALVAGVLVMPLFYGFARSVFNRHIAVIVLCMVAVSGPLVEYSALARGYSLTWLLAAIGLLAARHYVKAENVASLVLLALACAFGIFTTPAMIYPGLMCYVWAACMVLASYQSTARRRLLKLAGSLLLAVVLGFLLYTPVIVRHSLDQLIDHPSVVDDSWAHFMHTHQDKVFDTWAYFTDAAPTVLALGAAVGVIYAAYVSMKYRLLLFSLLVATVPVVLIQRVVAPPAVWTFTLFVLCLGTAIGLFYLLKLVRDKFAPKFSKANRALMAGSFVLLVFGWFGLRGEGDPVERYPEAERAAAWIKARTTSTDRVCAAMPWDAPVIFELFCQQGDTQVLQDGPRGEGATYVLVGPGEGQTPEGVMADAGIADRAQLRLHQVAGWKRLEVYGDR